jgi:ABC-2 type transport system ATP-binding protein
VEALAPYAKGEPAVERHTRRITVPVSGGASVLADVIRELDARTIVIQDIGLRRPTLDDVFLSLTGHATFGDEAEGEGEAGTEGAAAEGKDS